MQAVSPGLDPGEKATYEDELGGYEMVLDSDMGDIAYLDGNDKGDDDAEWDRDAARLFMDDSDEEGAAPGGGSRDPGGEGDVAIQIPEIPVQVEGFRRPRRYAVRDRRRKLHVPRVPTQQEREEHMLAHMPPEDYCEYCQRGKALARGHQKIHEDDRVGDVPTVSMDFAFLQRKAKPGCLPMFVLREKCSWGNKVAYS